MQAEYVKFVPDGEIIDGASNTLLKYMGDYKFKARKFSIY